MNESTQNVWPRPQCSAVKDPLHLPSWMTAFGPMTTLGPILQPSPIVAVGSYTKRTRGVKGRRSSFQKHSVLVSSVILAPY